MEIIFGHTNVYLDPTSDYMLSEINEREYLKELLLRLKENLKNHFKNFSFYILFSHNSLVVPDSAKLEGDNKILFWFSDESGSFPNHLIDKYCVIFKSYINKESSNVYSNPLGYINEFFNEGNRAPVAEKKGIFFSGNWNKNREGLYEFLFFRKYRFLIFLKLLPKRILHKIFRVFEIRNLSCGNNVLLFINGFKKGMNYKKYYNYLLNHKFILCPKGFHSSETFRHIEALHTGGIIISERMPVVSIYKNNPFLVYDNYFDLKRIFQKIKRSGYDCQALINDHKLYYENTFKIEAVAGRITEILKRELKRNFDR